MKKAALTFTLALVLSGLFAAIGAAQQAPFSPGRRPPTAPTA